VTCCDALLGFLIHWLQVRILDGPLQDGKPACRQQSPFKPSRVRTRTYGVLGPCGVLRTAQEVVQLRGLSSTAPHRGYLALDRYHVGPRGIHIDKPLQISCFSEPKPRAWVVIRDLIGAPVFVGLPQIVRRVRLLPRRALRLHDVLVGGEPMVGEYAFEEWDDSLGNTCLPGC
jgi:hypothetical protein